MNKFCPTCGHAVSGRSDKIYCSNNCRSISGYEKHIKQEARFLKILKILRKNRKILKAHNKNGISIIRQEHLKQSGFNEKYFTHKWSTKKGATYQFYFEFGLRAIKDKGVDKFLLIQHQKYMD